MFRRIPLTAAEEETSGWNFEQEVTVRLASEGIEEGNIRINIFTH
jgi:hypothetical protein